MNLIVEQLEYIITALLGAGVILSITVHKIRKTVRQKAKAADRSEIFQSAGDMTINKKDQKDSNE